MFLLAHPCLSEVAMYLSTLLSLYGIAFIILSVCMYSVVVSWYLFLHSLSPDTQLHVIENVRAVVGLHGVACM